MWYDSGEVTTTMNREEKKRETRDRIYNAALLLFAEQGYEATTVEQITKKANVAKGTFFNYFGNKEDVICDMQSFWAVEEIRKLHGKPGPYLPKLQGLLAEVVNRLQFNRSLARAMFQNTYASPKSYALQQTIYADLNAALTPIMAAGQENGEFTRRIPPDMLAYLTVQTFFGVLSFWSMGQGDDSLTVQLAVAFEVFFTGIKV